MVRDLAHPVNLGQSFLRRNEADISFRSKDVQLKLKGKCIALLPSSMTLTRSSIDTRIDKVLENWRNAGTNPPECNDMLDARINAVRNEVDSQPTPLLGLYQADYKRTMHIRDTKRHVTITHTVTIQPRSSQKIVVSTDKFAPRLQ